MQAPVDILAVLGTRPEAIKLAPVLDALQTAQGLAVRTAYTGQQADLAPVFLRSQAIRADHALDLMQPGEDFTDFARRAVAALAPITRALRPHAVMVQGDTSSALAGALCGALLGLPVVHVEAGLRTHHPRSPYPEEALRVMITHCASLHAAPTAANAANLRAEGIPANQIVVTGNPVVDAVSAFSPQAPASPTLSALLAATDGSRRVVLTCHRRENFGARARAYFRVLRRFVDAHPDVVLIFPVHPNPNVRRTAAETMGGHERILLTDPMSYPDFLGLVSRSELVVSDSGGIQEEAATLGVQLIILREVTERPEIVDAGLAVLAPDAAALARCLQAPHERHSRARQTHENPFGDGLSGPRIAHAVREFILT